MAAPVKLPPLPEGFEIETSNSSNLPPLPAGFELEGMTPDTAPGIKPPTVDMQPMDRLEATARAAEQGLANVVGSVVGPGTAVGNILMPVMNRLFPNPQGPGKLTQAVRRSEQELQAGARQARQSGNPVAEALAPFTSAPVVNLSNLGVSRSIEPGAARGVGQGVEEFGSALTTPVNALLGGGSAINSTMGRLMSAGFSLDMISHAMEKTPQIMEAIEAGDFETAARLTTEAVGSTVMAGLAGSHAIAREKAPSMAAGIKPQTPTERGTDMLTRLPSEQLVAVEDALKRQTAPAGAKPVTQPNLEAVRREIASRQRAGENIETTLSPQEIRRAGRERVTIPEKGPSIEQQRIDAARGPIAERLGVDLLRATADEIAVIDRLAQEGYSGHPTTPEPLGLSDKPKRETAQPEQRLSSLESIDPEESKPAKGSQDASTRQQIEFSIEPQAEPSPQPTAREPKTLPIYGRNTEVLIPGERKRYTATYSLREAEDVIPSHSGQSFEPRPEYQFKNDRNYSEPQNAERIIKQAAEFDPAFVVNDNPTAEQGPPIIDWNGNVLGGNSRTMTLERVRRSNPEAYTAYRERIRTEAKRLGLDPAAVDKMKEPVLVRQIVDEVADPQAAITDFNKVGTAELRQAERAIADSRRVSAKSLEDITRRIEDQGPDGTLAKALEGDATDLVNRLTEDGVLTLAERPRMMDGQGRLTAEGKQRMTRLLTGRLFEDARQFEDTAPELRQKLERVVAPLAKVEGVDGWDITDAVKEGVRLVEEARGRDLSIDELTAQRGMFGDRNYTPEAIAIAKKLQQKPTEVAKAFRQYAAESELGGGGQMMMGMEPPTPAESFREAFRTVDQLKADIKAQLTDERGSISGRRATRRSLAQNLTELAGIYIREGVEKFSEFLKRVRDEIGPVAAGVASRAWGAARRRYQGLVYGEVLPIGNGPFGPIYDQFQGNAQEAIRFLRDKKDGEAVGALYNRYVGSIDLPWGKEQQGRHQGSGLAKIIQKHPEVVSNLDDIIRASKPAAKQRDNQRYVELVSNNYRASVRVEFDGKSKRWLVTAMERTKPEVPQESPGGLDVAGRPAVSPSSTSDSDSRIDELKTEIKRQFRDERGSIRIERGQPEEEARLRSTATGSGGRGGRTTETATAAGAAPESRGAGGQPSKNFEQLEGGRRPSVSPQYERTKPNILKNVAPEVAKAMEDRLKDFEGRNPERKVVTFEDVREEARSLDPMVVAKLDASKLKAGETLDPAVRFAARETLNGLNQEINTRRQEMVKNGTWDEAKRTEEMRKIETMEEDAKRLIDVLIPTRSQDGRNLAYHAMMAKQSFDVTYWLSRARRASALPEGVELPPEVKKGILEITGKGAAAEAAAIDRIQGDDKTQTAKARRKAEREAKQELGPEPGGETSKSRLDRAKAAAKPDPTLAEKQARYRQKLLAKIEEKMQGFEKKPKAKSKWELTAAERAEVDNDPAVKQARIELARKMMRLDRSSWLETITTLRRAGLLTSVRTHMRNIGGNIAFQAMEEVSRLPAMAVDAALATFSGTRTVEGPSPRSLAKASRAAATRGVREAAEIMRKGATDDQLAQMDMVKELNSGNRYLDAYANTIFRSMSASDRIFKTFAYERSMQEQLKLTGKSEPTEAMRLKAWEDANFATFNNDNMAADGLKNFKAGLAKYGDAGRLVNFAIDLAIPFQRTPANIVARVIDYTPLGSPVRVAFLVKKTLRNAEGLTPEFQRKISMAIGRGAVGSALLTLGWKLSEAGLMTGIRPESRGESDANEAAGRMDGSFLIDGTWHRVDAFSPLGNLLTLGATLQREKERGAVSIVLAGTKTVMEQPMLSGAEDVIEAINSPTRSANKLMGGFAGSFVPSAVADVASALDDKRRDTKGDDLGSAIKAAVFNRVPGLRNTLPERRDVLGRSQRQEWTSIVDPTNSSEAKELSDEVLQQMVENRVVMQKQNKPKEMPIEQYQARQKLIGDAVQIRLAELIKDPLYTGETPGARRRLEARGRVKPEDGIKAVRREMIEAEIASIRSAFSRAEKSSSWANLSDEQKVERVVRRVRQRER